MGSSCVSTVISVSDPDVHVRPQSAVKVSRFDKASFELERYPLTWAEGGNPDIPLRLGVGWLELEICYSGSGVSCAHERHESI